MIATGAGMSRHVGQSRRKQGHARQLARAALAFSLRPPAKDAVYALTNRRFLLDAILRWLRAPGTSRPLGDDSSVQTRNRFPSRVTNTI